MRAVSGITARPGLSGGSVELAWTNPDPAAFAPARFAGVRVLRRERAHPTGPDDGAVVYDGPPVAGLRDAGAAGAAFHFYRIYTRDDAGGLHDGPAALAHGFAARVSGAAERLHDLLPSIHRRLDRPLDTAALAALTPQQRAALAALPADLADSGQLRRLALALFRPFDVVRSAAEALVQLREIDLAPPDALKALADSLGWALDETLPLARRRNDARFAPAILRRNGSVAGVATLIRRYTGWRVDLVESHQRLWRTHAPPRMALYRQAFRGGAWHAADDVAAILGLLTAEATGAAGSPAVVEGTATEPFALPAGASLTLAVGVEAPFTLRLAARDVDNIAAVRAEELARIVNALAAEVVASVAPGGRLRLETATVGPAARLRVEVPRASLLTVESAPAGRPVLVHAGADNAEVLLYDTADPLDGLARRAARETLQGLPPAVPDLPFAGDASPGGRPAAPTRHVPPPVTSRIGVKVRRNGLWLNSQPLATGDAPAASPAAARLGDGRLLLAWLAEPGTAASRVETRFGAIGAARPARLALGTPGPWRVPAGARLVLRLREGAGPPHDLGVVFSTLDFANPDAATAAELVAVLTTRLSGVTAHLRADGGVLLASVRTGGDVSLSADVASGASSAARALGLDAAQAHATGTDGDALTLAAAPAPPLPAAWLQAPYLAADGAGGSWLFVVAAGDGHRSLLATRFVGGAWGAVTTLAANAAEPAARLGSEGHLHLIYAQRDPSAPGRERWRLRRRRFDPALPGWDAESAITDFPVGGRAADREPALGPETAGGFTLLFSSDRAGGRALHQLAVPLASVPGAAPAPLLTDAARDTAPLPMLAGDGTLEVIHRSDAAVPPVRRPRHLPADGRIASRREDGLGLVPHGAGTVTVDPDHTARLGLRGRREDLLSYTVQRPLGRFGLRRRAGGPLLTGPGLGTDEHHSRETVTAYIRRATAGAPLTAERQARLAAVLARYQPINLRVVLAVAPERIVEDVYGSGREIEERWRDRGPIVEAFGPFADRTSAAAPALQVLVTNSPAHLTADPTDLTTLRNRLFFSPLA